MGPEHEYPAAVEDYVRRVELGPRQCREPRRRPELHWRARRQRRSANLAAVAALLARDAGGPALRLQSLVYPVGDYTLSGASYKKYAMGYGALTADAMAWFGHHYLRSPVDAEDWRASPIKAASHAGVAPAIVIVAECDVLHDDGESYAEALRDAGVPVEYREYRGMIHGFLGMVPVVDDAGGRPAATLGRLQTRLRLKRSSHGGDMGQRRPSPWNNGRLADSPGMPLSRRGRPAPRVTAESYCYAASRRFWIKERISAAAAGMLVPGP